MVSPQFISNFYSTSSGTKTHYLQTGDPTGTLLICLHGLGGSVNTFTSLAKTLPQTYSVVLVDFQGFGRTPLTSTTEPLAISNHVSDLHDLVTFLQRDNNGLEKGRKLVFIGHSLGSIVALHYAAKYTSDVTGLALLGAGRSASHIPFVRQRMLDVANITRTEGIEVVAKNSVANNFPVDQRSVPSKNLEEVRTAVAASDPEGYARTCEMIADLSHVDPDYSRITCPAVFVAGDLDTISPLQRSEDISKLLGGPTVVEVVKSGHQPLIDDFDSTVSAIQMLLEKL